MNFSALRFLAALYSCYGVAYPFGEPGQIGGNSKTYFSATREEKSKGRYFENWTDLSYKKDSFRFDLGYEAHLPPEPSSRDTIGQGIYQRTFTFMEGGFALKAGNYLTKLGNGLTLVAERNRDVGLNTNLDGVYSEYASSWIEGKGMAASPRDAVGKRYAALQAGELRFSILKSSFLGATYVTTRTSRNPNDYWGSLYAGANGRYGDIQAEWAARSFAENHSLGRITDRYAAVFPEGKALYVAGSLLLGRLTLFGEAKHYQDFNLFEGPVYNNPPAGVKEHVFSLPNKRQPVQNADNEKGVHLSAEFPLLGENQVSFDFSKILGVGKEYALYEEYYAQIELNGWGPWSGIAATGIQTDLESRNLNFILYPTVPISENYALKGEWQHQHTEILLTHRMYYGQHYTLSLERSPNLILSLIMETATDQLENNPVQVAGVKLWSGVQVNWSFLGHHDLALFAGTRKKGKICAGGVCVLKPELKGVELSFNSHF